MPSGDGKGPFGTRGAGWGSWTRCRGPWIDHGGRDTRRGHWPDWPRPTRGACRRRPITDDGSAPRSDRDSLVHEIRCLEAELRLLRERLRRLDEPGEGLK